MRVSVSGIRSSFIEVRSGVPQGSVLGLLLFVLFVNDVPTFVISKCKFFADDLKIYLNLQRSNIVEMSSDLSRSNLHLWDCNLMLKNTELCVLHVKVFY